MQVKCTKTNILNVYNDNNSNRKINNSKELNLSKVDILKNKIESGEYKIDLNSTASKFANELLGF